MMLPDMCGSSLLFSLPDDIFSVITRSLSPRDISSLGLGCRGLHALVASDKVWLPQCDKLGLVPCNTLVEWRNGVCSYKALCRFLLNIRPLTGIWVHQNPELGNVVYVMPGFLSVIGCRIIPQEVGPLGLDEGPILWTPVFEVLCDHEGSAQFFLHGSEKGADYVYPGMLKSGDMNCNVLLLEVEPRHRSHGGRLAFSKSLARGVDNHRVSSLESMMSKSSSERVLGQKGIGTSFNRLGFGDRRRLLDVVTSQVQQLIPETANSVLIPRLGNNEFDPKRDFAGFYERRLLLLQMLNGDGQNIKPSMLGLSEACKTHGLKPADGSEVHCAKSKTLSSFLRNSLKQILGTSTSANGNHESSSQKKNGSGCENKHVQLREFLKSGDTIGLSLRAATMKLSSYRAWPNMHDSRFALYKLPVRAPKPEHKYAGLWGGTFGWPPGNPSEDKPGKALFLILISYEESEHQSLIATKILEGTSYVLHPNGSAMFIVNVDQPSLDTFPWGGNKECDDRVDVKESFVGEGIANGYGFRYPGAKPGSLFVVEDGLLVFVWKESRAVLTLQRLDLADLLRKGERVPCLSPVSNFAYLTKTYSNVFSGFSNSANVMASPSCCEAKSSLLDTRLGGRDI